MTAWSVSPWRPGRPQCTEGVDRGAAAFGAVLIRSHSLSATSPSSATLVVQGREAMRDGYLDAASAQNVSRVRPVSRHSSQPAPAAVAEVAISRVVDGRHTVARASSKRDDLPISSLPCPSRFPSFVFVVQSELVESRYVRALGRRRPRTGRPPCHRHSTGLSPLSTSQLLRRSAAVADAWGEIGLVF